MKPVYGLKIKALSICGHLTDWESNFILSLKNATSLTKKQQDKVNVMYRERVKGIFTFNEYKGMSNTELAMAWNDVHDFDR
jgi:hypothetical protein